MEIVSVIDPMDDNTPSLNILPIALQMTLKEVLRDGLIIFKFHRSPNAASTGGDLVIAKRNPEALWISGYEDRIIYDGRRGDHEKYAGLISMIIEGLGSDFFKNVPVAEPSGKTHETPDKKRDKLFKTA